jgi:large subunit ribosomal protein L31
MRRASVTPAAPGNAAQTENRAMKAGIHPVYELRTFHCYGCSTEWQIRTTIEPHSSDGKIHLDICSNCHPFFTGKQKLIDKAGRIERFRRRYSKKEAPGKEDAAASAEPTPAETTQR